MWQQAQCHGPCEPQPELLTVLIADPQGQAILTFVILDRHLVNVHADILGAVGRAKAQSGLPLEKLPHRPKMDFNRRFKCELTN